MTHTSRTPRSPWLSMLVALLLVAALTPVGAGKTIDFDALTITDINHAFDAGVLTSEKLVQLCLARIQAYDRQGPSLHAVMTLNPKALDTARALDAERKAKGPRSPLHGIPVVLKDNYNTFDLPTTGGGQCCSKDRSRRRCVRRQEAPRCGRDRPRKGEHVRSPPPGAARSAASRSVPHDLTRTPSGSSGGTGVAIAAACAPV